MGVIIHTVKEIEPNMIEARVGACGDNLEKSKAHREGTLQKLKKNAERGLD